MKMNCDCEIKWPVAWTKNSFFSCKVVQEEQDSGYINYVRKSDTYREI